MKGFQMHRQKQIYLKILYPAAVLPLLLYNIQHEKWSTQQTVVCNYCISLRLE